MIEIIVFETKSKIVVYSYISRNFIIIITYKL